MAIENPHRDPLQAGGPAPVLCIAFEDDLPLTHALDPEWARAYWLRVEPFAEGIQVLAELARRADRAGGELPGGDAGKKWREELRRLHNRGPIVRHVDRGDLVPAQT